MTTTHDSILHSSTLLNIGIFDCPVDAPDFSNTGAIEGYLLVFPRTSVKIRHMDMDRAFVADPNTVTIYNKGQEYERYPISKYGDRCDWIALSPEIICEILTDLGINVKEEPENIFQISHSVISVKVYSEFRTLINNLLNTPKHDSLLAQEWALRIYTKAIAEIYSGHRKIVKSKQDRTSIKHRKLACRCIELLTSRYTEALTLDLLARELNTSSYHLCRVFRNTIGLPIHQYLSQLRLRSALHLVAETDTDLSTLGLDLGFSDHSHFSYYFRKTFGQSPSAYRSSRGFSNALFANEH